MMAFKVNQMTTITKTRKSKSKWEKSPDEEMAALEAAAEAKDELAFLNAQKGINWDHHSAEDFDRAVDLALMAGTFMAARHLSKEGTERFPEHAELQRMAHILAPPIARVVKGVHNTTWKADREWLKMHWDDYRGLWVALYNGELLGAEETLDDLVKQVGEINGTGILVTPIW